MTAIYPTMQLPDAIETKLRAVQRRRRILTVLELCVTPLLMLLVAMVFAMVLDGVLELPNRALRVMVTGTAFACAAAALWYCCRRALLMQRTRRAAALAVDRATPALQERWSTVTELAETDDDPRLRGAESLIKRVTDEATGLTQLVHEEQVVDFRLVRRLAIALGLGLALWLIVLAVSPSARFLFRRFANPATAITFTQITSDTADKNVPRHEALALAATVSGRVRPEVELVLRGEDGTEKVVALTPGEKEPTRFAHTIASVDDTFDFQFRSGDGRTAWHRITPFDRPNLADIRFSVTPPPPTRNCRPMSGGRCRASIGRWRGRCWMWPSCRTSRWRSSG